MTSALRPETGRAPLLTHQRVAAGQILQGIEEGTYSALLGPHFSGKTALLRTVEQEVAARWQWPCVYVDLSQLEASTQRAFFGQLANLAAQRIGEQTGLQLARPETTVTSSAAFRAFLAEAVEQIERDLVILIDQLEALPTDLVQALLTSLRAAYMEQQTLEHRLLVVASGALSLAALAVGESSPFRGIARRVFLGDLTELDSEALVAQELVAACAGPCGQAREGIRVTDGARRRLLQATRGDPYLIRRICRASLHTAAETASGQLTARTVGQVVQHFMDDEVDRYPPLQEAVRTIEGEPDLLRGVLLLLQHGAVPRSELPLPLSPDLDPLYLTGVVERVTEPSDGYRLRNDIYHRFLAARLEPARVGHLLTSAGEWDAAIDALEASIQRGDEAFRADLQLATIHSMYAAEDLNQAAHFLLRGLAIAFEIEDAQVWMASPHENSLRRVGPASARHGGTLLGVGAGESPLIALHEDCLEARAFREATSLRGHESSKGVVRAIPLLSEGRRPIGVVCLSDWLVDRLADQRERELQLVSYLNQAARALRQVSQRTRELALAGRVQAGLLPPVPDVAGWQLAAAMQPARVIAGDFYDIIPLPGGRLGLVIADVADKGLGSALYMALGRTLIRTFATQHPDEPATVLTSASRRILQDARAGLFVTVFYGVIDLAVGTLTYCNAGHPPALLVRAGASGPPLELARTGMALGAVEETAWRQAVVAVAPGDLLVLYTDGLVDAHSRSQERFGKQRLVDLLTTERLSSAGGTGADSQVQGRRTARRASEVHDALLSAVRSFVGDEAQFDDVTLVVVRREETAPEITRERIWPPARSA